ncbi:cyclin-like protein [Calocera cornea HHB12733]|uniref:Cyclin-like protein n=1 Tax=Calocera cornea HHB12733 TaxID=1353952 RepID=A0A165CHM9_9BASI|nr:cyclin-like protein [Calocera cornea HHB12733]
MADSDESAHGAGHGHHPSPTPSSPSSSATRVATVLAPVPSHHHPPRPPPPPPPPHPLTPYCNQRAMSNLPDELVQWLFTPSALYATPSQADGYSVQQERVERARGVEFLFRVGLQLGMHQHTMSAAAVFFHRFYMRYSFLDYHRFEIAATCLFLAGKVEENGRKLHDVACAIIIKLHRTSSSQSQSTTDLLKTHEREVARFEHLITVYELLLADALAFDLEVAHAQGVLVIALDALLAPDDVGDLSWTIANDTLYTVLCVLHPARVLAAACYLLALALLRQPALPWAAYLAPGTPGPEQEKWRDAFGLSSAEDLKGVRDAASVMLEFWRSMDDETRRLFNTKLEDIPAHLGQLSPPEEGRDLASYAPVAQSPHVNGNGNGTGGGGGADSDGKVWTVVGGEGTPWQSQSGPGTPWASGGVGGSPAAGRAMQEGVDGAMGAEQRGPMGTSTPRGRGSPWAATPPSA